MHVAVGLPSYGWPATGRGFKSRRSSLVRQALLIEKTGTFTMPAPPFKSTPAKVNKSRLKGLARTMRLPFQEVMEMVTTGHRRCPGNKHGTGRPHWVKDDKKQQNYQGVSAPCDECVPSRAKTPVSGAKGDTET